jgi:hypothetical protein
VGLAASSSCAAPVAGRRQARGHRTIKPIGLMRRLLTGDSLRLIEERDRRASTNPLGKVKCIPIGKPDAAMRAGFADLFRVARSMNSVGRLVQVDPDQPDRVVGTGRDGEFCIGSHTFEPELRIVMIGGSLTTLPTW